MERGNVKNMKTINNMEELNEVLEENKDKNVFVQFSASWCGPCKLYTRNLESLEDDYKDSYLFVKADIEDDSRFVTKFKIQGVPRTVIFAAGEQLDSFVGSKNLTDIKSILERNSDR